MCFYGFPLINKSLLKSRLKGFLSGDGMKRYWFKTPIGTENDGSMQLI